MTENSPPTVAGAAAAWALESRTAFPFDPFSGTVTVKLRGRSAAVKATVHVHDYPDGRLAIFRGGLPTITRTEASSIRPARPEPPRNSAPRPASEADPFQDLSKIAACEMKIRIGR
jgi:hypothetical protein